MYRPHVIIFPIPFTIHTNSLKFFFFVFHNSLSSNTLYAIEIDPDHAHQDTLLTTVEIGVIMISTSAQNDASQGGGDDEGSSFFEGKMERKPFIRCWEERKHCSNMILKTLPPDLRISR
jgi:hypothetical protein